MASKKGKAGKAVKSKQSKVFNKAMPPPPPSSKPSFARPGSTMLSSHQILSTTASSVCHRPTSEINVSEQHSFELARTVMTATVSICKPTSRLIVAYHPSRLAPSLRSGSLLVTAILLLCSSTHLHAEKSFLVTSSPFEHLIALIPRSTTTLS